MHERDLQAGSRKSDVIAGLNSDTRPRAEGGREIISVRGLLEWAFAVECATLDYDEVGAALGIGLPASGAECRIAEQLSLGFELGEGVRPDTSFGYSYPHDDAELVATILRNCVQFELAVRVAELARACTAPKWDLGQQVLQPRNWGRRNQRGLFGKTEVVRTIEYVVGGRKRKRQDHWVPCIWVPTVSQIAAARRGYLDWWGALLSVSAGLKAVDLDRFVVSKAMPPMTPWKKKT